MKILNDTTKFNSLSALLDLLDSKEPVPVTLDLFNSIKTILSIGGILCESNKEVIECLLLLDKMGIFKVVAKQEETGVSYLIGNLYNGK